jgi:hypothetical protein
VEEESAKRPLEDGAEEPEAKRADVGTEAAPPGALFKLVGAGLVECNAWYKQDKIDHQGKPVYCQAGDFLALACPIHTPNYIALRAIRACAG